MGPEELGFIEHVLEHACQLLLVEHREQAPVLVADESIVGRGDVGEQFGMPPPGNGKQLPESRMVGEIVLLENR
jgi:hypothetical protein